MPSFTRQNHRRKFQHLSKKFEIGMRAREQTNMCPPRGSIRSLKIKVM